MLKFNANFMNDQEKHNLGPQPEPTSGGEAPEAERDCLEGLKRQAREVVYRNPEVRSEKVAALKEAISAGTYEIDSAKLAEILIEELNLKR